MTPIEAPPSDQYLQDQALTQLLQILPNLAPALQQAQQDATNYATASATDQDAIIVRLINNVALLAEGVQYAFVHLGLIPSS